MFDHSRVYRMILSIIVLFSLGASTNPNQAKALPSQQAEISKIAAESQAGNTIYLPAVSTGQSRVVSMDDWATVGADPQRTSVVEEEVAGTINTGSLKVSWYRAIDAYIPQNVQLIAAGGLIYVATARGLYALDAASGNLAWRFDTEMPIGNSPAVSNGVVYVAGYDRKVHALSASNGAHLWEFDEAQAGFEGSPLVVENMVILGNRDGYLYAIGAQGNSRPGQLIWKYQTGGPIHMTAAYKNGVVYVGSGDMYAYAVSTGGDLIWKSSKLPGDGFQSYWPVIFTDPATQNDLVVFSGASGYRWEASPGDGSPKYTEIEDLFYDKSTSPDTPVATQVTVNQPWAAGKTVLNYSRVAEYYENNPQANAHLHKPWRRPYFVLNTSNGTEYTYDSDRDGYQEYAPILPFGTGSGNHYPPVVGKDGLLYFSNMLTRNGIGQVMGWRVGTQYMVLGGSQGDHAEPQAISGGGDLIYRSICCDRVGDWFDTMNPSNSGIAWHYIFPLSDLAPGYDVKWWFAGDPSNMERLFGSYGTVNGAYHNHGDQNPIIPYGGRLYIHRSNSVIAFGPNAGPKLSMVSANKVTRPQTTPTKDDLKSRLTREVSKMIAAGHLRPGYYNAGQFNIYNEFNDYFSNPGDTLYALASAYPYVDASIQPQLKTYLKTEFGLYFDPGMYSYIGWADGAAREAAALPPEVEADMKNFPKVAGAGPAWTWQYPQVNFYGMWKYAEVFPADAARVYDLAKSKLQVPLPAAATTERFRSHPWELNGYIAGYIGFLNLQTLAGKSTTDAALRTQVTNELNRLESLRANNFTKDTPYADASQVNSWRTLNIARNFIMLVPELGDYLHDNAYSKVQTALAEYNTVAPYWFVSRYNASIGESTMENLYDYPALFQAYAYIMQLPYEQLSKYLDAPAFEKGDLFYLQNLVAALEAP